MKIQDMGYTITEVAGITSIRVYKGMDASVGITVEDENGRTTAWSVQEFQEYVEAAQHVLTLAQDMASTKLAQ